MEALSFLQKQSNHIHYHVLPTEQFKTNTIVVNVQQDLRSDTVTKTALLAQIMNRGSREYPTTKRMRARLEELYGALYDVHVFKKGERQILQFRLQIANEKYLADTAPLLSKGIAFLAGMIGEPLAENGAFSDPFVRQEKETLKKKIESILDDKIQFASMRLVQEMCREEPYRYLALGEKEALSSITPEDLYAYYQTLFSRNPIDIYLVGDVQPEQAFAELERVFSRIPREETPSLSEQAADREVREEREVVDRMNVKQGKLNIGCRTHIRYADDDYVPLMMYNGILGGFPHSKLFVNVREKESLAYYAVSRMESHKGLLMLMSGIEVANYEKAVEIMKKQMRDMQEGRISDEELQQTRATLANQLKEKTDSALGLIDWAFNQAIAGRERRLEEILAQLEAVTTEDIRRVAQEIEIDTVYFLRDKGEDQ